MEKSHGNHKRIVSPFILTEPQVGNFGPTLPIFWPSHELYSNTSSST